VIRLQRISQPLPRIFFQGDPTGISSLSRLDHFRNLFTDSSAIPIKASMRVSNSLLSFSPLPPLDPSTPLSGSFRIFQDLSGSLGSFSSFFSPFGSFNATFRIFQDRSGSFRIVQDLPLLFFFFFSTPTHRNRTLVQMKMKLGVCVQLTQGKRPSVNINLETGQVTRSGASLAAC